MGCSLFEADIVQREHPQNSGGIGVVAVSSRKHAIALKRGTVGPSER